jgi:hypothetical protein
LINTGRTYAAFRESEVYPLVEKLANRGEILDPTAGYGLLARYCSKIGISAYSVELNPAQYLWQVLSLPSNVAALIAAIELTSNGRIRPDTALPRAVVCRDWYPEQSKRILRWMLSSTQSYIGADNSSRSRAEELSLSLLVPFVGRLSCSVPGDNSTQIKLGGICVYEGWENDYRDYLCAVRTYLEEISAQNRSPGHVVRLGDCRTIALPIARFSAMITSPPYPNHRDYSTMFAPENAFLEWLGAEDLIGDYTLSGFIIGSNFVSGKPIPEVHTEAARHFLRGLKEFKGSVRAIYDNKVYYIPYFAAYFHDLEESFRNVAISLQRDFEGYIIVVNNTTRNLVIPVAESIIEIWRNMGFQTEVVEEREKFHVGTKNPRARGFKAKHKEYTIKVWRT